MSDPVILAVNGFTPRIDPTAFIAPNVVVAGNVEIGPHATIWFGSVLRAEDAPITIGEGANLQDMCLVHTDPGVPSTIAAGAALGHRATIHGATIEEGALVGVGAIVLNHAVIGAGALVAGGAVVPERAQVPPRVLVAGVPAKQVRELGDDASFAVIALAYQERARMYRDALGW